MEDSLRPVVVFQGNSEFEAQIVRDVLEGSMIPVVHIPSISTGIFGVASRVRVAVPEEFAEQAITAIREAGLEPSTSEVPTGMAAVEDAVQEKVIAPLTRGLPRLPEKSWLRVVQIVLLILIGGLVAYTLYRR